MLSRQPDNTVFQLRCKICFIDIRISYVLELIAALDIVIKIFERQRKRLDYKLTTRFWVSIGDLTELKC